MSDFLRVAYRKMVDSALRRTRELFLENPDMQKDKALEYALFTGNIQQVRH